MTSEGLREFGNHVREARVRRGWTLETLAEAALNNPERKGYVSQIENGKRPLSALTIGNLARVLDLPPEVTRPLLFAPAEQDEVTREDRVAETLIRRTDADPAPPQAEALVIALAYEFAGGKFLDLPTAYIGLRNALQTAADMRAELDRMHNLDERLAAVLRRVADLNDQGLREEAGDALDAAIKAKEAELDGLHEAALKQDRLRNNPAAAAKRLINRLRAAAPPGGLLLATHHLLNETCERGKRQGDPFDLVLALELAKANLDRAKGPKEATALNDLGNCHFAIGEHQSGSGHLTHARNAFERALQQTPRQRDRQNWAVYLHNHGKALGVLGQRAADPKLMQRAVDAYRAVLSDKSLSKTPKRWAEAQNNLGNCIANLGKLTADPALLQHAIEAYRAALSVRRREDIPMDWALSQGNLGTALCELGELTACPDLLKQAVDAHRAALTVLTPEDTPIDWATSQGHLGLALRWLGTFEGDAALLHGAAAAYTDCLTKRTRDAVPFYWAQTQWNLADLALARHALTPDAALLDTARNHLSLAREVFSDEGNDHQLAECDRLQAQINAVQRA